LWWSNPCCHGAAVATVPAAAAPQGFGGGQFGNRYTHRGGGEGLRLVVTHIGHDYSSSRGYLGVNVYKTENG
jgi:hypothetical protein